MGLTVTPGAVDRFFDRLRDALPVHVPRAPSRRVAVGLFALLVALGAPAFRARIAARLTRQERALEVGAAVAYVAAAALLALEVRRRVYRYEMFSANLGHFTVLKWIPPYVQALRSGAAPDY